MRPGTKAIIAVVAAAFAVDVWLIRRGHDTISTCVRESRNARIATAVLAGHLMTTLPFDPITRSGDAVERWFNNGPRPRLRAEVPAVPSLQVVRPPGADGPRGR